jgi:hypothetical protein
MVLPPLLVLLLYHMQLGLKYLSQVIFWLILFVRFVDVVKVYAF